MYILDDLRKVNFPALSKDQYYIYVLLNSPQGNIKVGRTSDICERLVSLSGSNGGGNKIVKVAVSDATYLYTLESIIHHHFCKFRIKGTEWFHGDELQFDDVVQYIDSLFSSSAYELCNRIRYLYRDKVVAKKEQVAF